MPNGLTGGRLFFLWRSLSFSSRVPQTASVGTVVRYLRKAPVSCDDGQQQHFELCSTGALSMWGCEDARMHLHQQRSGARKQSVPASIQGLFS